jgi:hypothetical protein
MGDREVMRFRIFIAFFAISLGILSLSTLSKPAHGSWFSSDSPNPFKTFIPFITHHAEDTIANPPLPSLADFIGNVIDASGKGVRGVYVPAAFAYYVVSQPDGNYSFISTQPNTVTEYSLASTGVEGLLGHVALSGKAFSTLTSNQDLVLIWADGSTRHFKIAYSHRYQALEPNSANTYFIDLENGATVTPADLFIEYYMGSAHITFQTCILKDGNPNWGRLFVVAEPVD